VLFASDRRGSQDAWLIAVSGGQPQGEPILVRSNLGERSEALGFTRSGAFFFSGGTGGRDVFSAKLDIQKGKLLSNPEEAAGSNLGSNWGPDFSRDGKSLAYVTGQGGIAIQSLETTDKKTIKPDYEIRRAGRMYGLRWAPDGRSFVVTGVDGQGRKGLLRINSFTGQTALLFESDSAMMPPFDLSPDGKKIYYISDPLGSLLFVWDSESGQKRQLGDKKIWSLAVSPDGGQLAFFGSGGQAEPSGLFVIPSTGGSPRLMVESKDRRGAVAWSPDGTQLLYAVSSKSSDNGTPATLRYELWRVSSQGGEPQRFGLTVDGMMMSLRIHPDGQRIAYGTLWSSLEIWVMENFLPKEKIEENSQLTLRKLDNSVLNTPYARLSPDGRYISYPDWNTGDLAIQDMVTGKDRRLTNKGSWASSSDYAEYSLFSPDSKQVAYTWRIWSKNQTELRIIGTDGSQSRVIYKGDDSWPVSWSSNGKYILVKLMNKDRTWRPAIITVADSSVQDLAFQISGAMCFSPDGKYIAYDTPQIKDVQQRDVYIYEIATKRTFPMVKHPSDDGLLEWAPDGKHLLFTSDRSGTRDAWLIAVSGGQTHGEPALVRKNIGDIESIGFTQSGDFYFHESIEGHNIYSARLDLNSGKLLSPPVENAGSYLGSNWRPDFSRDGKFMAYISNRGSGEDQGNTIVIRSLETGKEQLLKPALEIGFGLRWAPDGNFLFVNGTDKTKKEGLFRVDTQTGEANLIVEHHFVGVPGLEVSPDGRKIFYTAVPGSGIPDGEAAYDVRHYAFDLQTGQEKELAHPGNTPLVPIALSPDGKQLAFIGAGDKAGSAGICVMPVSGGPSKQLVNIGTTGWASRVIAWTPDGRYLIYAVMLTKTQNTNLGQTSWQLWRVSAEGGEPQRLDLKIDGLLRHLRIHPDGQQIIYYTWRGDTESWVMENFLPK
jgi:Tol biopolymer transport system component